MWLWSFLSVVAALVTWLILTANNWGLLRETGIRPRAATSGLVLLRLALAAGLFGSGFILEPAAWGIFRGDYSPLYNQLANWPTVVLYGGLIPGTVVTIVADQAKTTKDRFINTALAAAVVLVIVDDVLTIFMGRVGSDFLFSVVSDLVGGGIGGAVMAFVHNEIKGVERRWLRTVEPAA